jgi:hypothetical protein
LLSVPCAAFSYPQRKFIFSLTSNSGHEIPNKVMALRRTSRDWC